METTIAIAVLITSIFTAVAPLQPILGQGGMNTYQQIQFDNDKRIDENKLTQIRLPFIENQGQIDQEVRFYANTFAGTVSVTEDSVMYALITGEENKGVLLRERFLTDQPLNPIGTDRSTTIVNYFVGEKENWRSSIPTYNAVFLGELWALIDVELHAYGENVEKVFKVYPGGSIDDIRLTFDGVRNLKISENGELLLETELGTVSMTKPYAFQNIAGLRVPVEIFYLVDGGSYGFVVDNYNTGYTLEIDPLLASTFIGGSGFDEATAIAFDGAGNAFVTGLTVDAATDYPTTGGAFDTTHNGSTDVFVSKLNNNLSSLLASTFIGGSDFDDALGITLDGSGNVFVTGFTDDAPTDYPTTGGAFDTSHNGLVDVFVSKFTSNLAAQAPPPSRSVGGEILPIDFTSLLILGILTNAYWILPILAIGALIAFIKVIIGEKRKF